MDTNLLVNIFTSISRIVIVNKSIGIAAAVKPPISFSFILIQFVQGCQALVTRGVVAQW